MLAALQARKAKLKKSGPPKLADPFASDPGFQALKKQINQVDDKLFISDKSSAANQTLLQDAKVTHILVVGAELKVHFPDDYKYMHIKIPDHTDIAILGHFETAFAFIAEGISSGGTLIHCAAGQSRSASFLIGYLMKQRQESFAQVLAFVRTNRSIIDPNSGFQDQLRQFHSNSYVFTTATTTNTE
jgi:predicted protein tyrosine phosphatase